ncbi:MAG: FAD-binding oxidoreductase [Chloroflexota bacterium]
MTTQRRWNGWGDPSVEVALPERAIQALRHLVGPGTPPTDATLASVVAAAAPARIRDEPGLSVDPEDRVRHARGQDASDWIALRSGRLPALPDAVAHPASAAAVRDLLDRATAAGWSLVPYGGGTSVVGGVTVVPSARPVVAVDLAGTAGLRHLDRASGLATFGAGTAGPDMEAALGPHGLTVGHAPQSFEFSTVGGWVASRSSGQTSIGHGRIERLFAGGRLEAPTGTLEMPPFPASAAGPDLREMVLGSEGRLGILTDVTLRSTARRAREVVRAYSVPDWERAWQLGRELAGAGLPLAMVRVSTPLETMTTLVMAPDGHATRLLRRYLAWRRQGPDACLLLVGMEGSDRLVRATEGEVVRQVRARRGIGVPGLGPAWHRERFRSAYLRNALWTAGYGVDTVETAVDWSGVVALAEALGPALRTGLEAQGELVHAFSHLSHLYPSGSSLYVTYIFRLAADPDQTLRRWQQLKRLASETIVAHGGTISHQHGVGRVHAPYLEAEKGPLGMDALKALVERLDPAGIMHRGVLLDDDAGGVS